MYRIVFIREHATTEPISDRMPSPDISFQDALLCSIMPLMEEEINKRVAIQLERHLIESKAEYATLRKQYNELTRKCAALESEMSRSRQIFEEKRKEWHDIKMLMTQSLQAKESQVTRSVESEELAQTITQPNIESRDNKDILSQPTLETDPLNFLATNFHSASSQEVFSQKSAASAEVIAGVVNAAPRCPTPSKVARYVEPMRNKAERKNAHAKDCICCAKFYKVAGVDDENRSHIQTTSRHRFRHDLPDSPPGFWDVNFTLKS